jgi:heme/copper-type cytochrome/quinol oxidase subunit 2
MRSTLFVAVALASLAACSPVKVSDTGNGSSSSSPVPTLAASSVQAVTTTSSSSEKMVKPLARIIDVTVTNWTFAPAVITVKKGEKVQLRLKGDDGIHSLLMTELGINVRVEAGKETIVNLPTEKLGTFGGRCGVPCGSGHRDMAMTVIVE